MTHISFFVHELSCSFTNGWDDARKIAEWWFMRAF
jgi:hypothetical protein